ncbi:LPO_1073/Vpar_1526 family protein [Aliarcobacter butzleri]|uniref:LPO_1073/Vpar_1526 family protein n=1 Tax=Aliarcobacter butzleri TaxID=28197 RepID=UPI00189D685D|nr:LPO_1073/Vpar_1526 family protein [Aliarcobacter butzleri]MBF7064629.1 hypothetical protein [Aliarcobacter butzleri]MCG3697736.1 hypothetical protein [Aliarcobacter butzleri]
MINDKKLEQTSGSDSTNIQVAGNLTVGLSYSDAKDIALDIYKQNFLELSEKATEKALDKVEHFVNDFLTKLFEKKDENLIKELETPSFQMTLLEAQKEAIKADDKSIEEILSNILLERTKEKERNLRRIAFDEAISVISKLTQQQMDILSLNYILKDLEWIMNWHEGRFNIVTHIFQNIVPKFEVKVGFKSPDISHLLFSGCINKPDYSEFKGDFFSSEEGVFQKGFDKETFENEIGSSIFNSLLMNSEHYDGKFQLDYIYSTELTKKMSELTEDLELRKKLINFSKKNKFLPQDKIKLFKEKYPESSFLFNDTWSRDIYKYELSPVGVAIAISNLMNKWDFPYTLPFPYHMRNM